MSVLIEKSIINIENYNSLEIIDKSLVLTFQNSTKIIWECTNVNFAEKLLQSMLLLFNNPKKYNYKLENVITFENDILESKKMENMIFEIKKIDNKESFNLNADF